MNKPIIISDEIDCNSQMTKSTRASYTMQVSFRHFWKVKVNHYINGLYIYAPCE